MRLAFGYFLNVLLFLTLPLLIFFILFLGEEILLEGSFLVGWGREGILEIGNFSFASGSSEVI